MNLIGKGLGGLAVVCAIAVVTLASWEPFLAEQPGPPPPPRDYRAEVVRDEWGVPHILGKTDPDVAFGSGLGPGDPPIIAAHAAFITKKSGKWTLEVPEKADKLLIDTAKSDYIDVASSNPQTMGKSKACYSRLRSFADLIASN